MTLKQKQCLLAYLGFYNGAIDGIWGTGSKNAAASFRKAYGLPVGNTITTSEESILMDAVTGKRTPVKNEDISWDNIRYFKKSEFKCKCGRYCNGYPAEVDLGMVKIADAIRAELGKPVQVNSGLRCKTHNANVGGAANSQHCGGKAADLGAPSGVTPAKMAAIAEKIMGNTGGIGVYPWGIHIDNRGTKARWNG